MMLPCFAPYTFRRRISQKHRRWQGSSDVILWLDTFNNHFHPETAEAALEVLQAAGYRVGIPRLALCCGRPLYDFGFLDTAKRLLREILDHLQPELESGTPIVVLEPSCAAVFRDELVNLFPEDANAKRLCQQTFLLSEFLDKNENNLRVADCWQSDCPGPLSSKSLMGMESEARLLSKIGLEAEILDSGCCGMAGSFGFEAGESQLIHQDAQRTYALIFDKGDEFISEITRLTKEQKLDASHFMALGAFRSAVLGFFDMESERPREFPWRLRLRCYPWSATLPPRMVPPRLMRTWCSAKMMALPSTAISRRSHLAHLEVVLTESPSHLCRRTDEETGLAVIEFQSLVANDYLIVRRCSRIAGTPKAVCQVQHAAPHPDECFPRSFKA